MGRWALATPERALESGEHTGRGFSWPTWRHCPRLFAGSVPAAPVARPRRQPPLVQGPAVSSTARGYQRSSRSHAIPAYTTSRPRTDRSCAITTRVTQLFDSRRMSRRTTLGYDSSELKKHVNPELTSWCQPGAASPRRCRPGSPSSAPIPPIAELASDPLHRPMTLPSFGTQLANQPHRLSLLLGCVPKCRRLPRCLFCSHDSILVSKARSLQLSQGDSGRPWGRLVARPVRNQRHNSWF